MWPRVQAPLPSCCSLDRDDSPQAFLDFLPAHPKTIVTFPCSNHHSSLFRPSATVCVSVCFVLYVCVFTVSPLKILRSLKTEVCLFFISSKASFSKHIPSNEKAPCYFKYNLTFPYEAVIWSVLENPHSSDPSGRGMKVRMEKHHGAKHGQLSLSLTTTLAC